MIYFGGFRKKKSKTIPGYEEFESLDIGEGLYNKDRSNVSLIYSGDSIPYDYFNRNSTLKIIFGKNIKYVGRHSFSICRNLVKTFLPQTTIIDNYGFASCSALTQVLLPSVTTLGNYTFSSCSKLPRISLPNVTYIGVSAFSSCSSLVEVVLPSATTVGGSLFSSCYKLKKITCKQGMRARIQQLIQDAGLTQSIEIIEV